ncbi:Diguanylate cyclase (GGDEF) domain-containing protein [Pseudomonas sp. IT-P44]|jgi:diguanylate cyclase (GGDEF)-like protein|uniref:diguanylate cyclase n=1 Tax=Pseudomonas migulae TaxID=78543 RepID=A0ABY8N0C0_9PSED|nr:MULTISPECIES: GGDEF domain-containing protein [Pseudomonas]EJM79710.1 diguanylate cyclase (GGDEF) domain-containing protein [Pseudomonas sp. GM60]EJM83526.1 diguanylate cyclase (GGDEF) domain-containing protein [Pseudomonas sp. GM67]MBD9548452.1 GGDEF domain-containing protein [Pseudomonas sp. PDM01]MBD9610130.1 GGDEF domain-containing protein [Pseudomonas sp. PDM02]MCP1517277.1 diguanylate cyclase (GGDEF)-like protein [Pseudomonas migulae]
MKSPSQTNAIDFDSAKLQRLGFGQQPPLLERPVSLAQLRQQLSLQLQTSLEPQRILGLFYREIQRLVPLDALSYQHKASDLRLEYGQRGHHSISYTLSHEGEQLGELVFRRNQRFSEQELGNLESLLSALLYPMRNALLYRAATQSALRDPLTDTGNRIAMDQTLQREIDMSRRHLQPLSLLMLDIDHFKQINDTHGHSAGDDVLKGVAASIKSQLRNVDMVFRFGGEEFLILLSNTGREAAAMVGERLRLAAQAKDFSADGNLIELTVSLGCSTLLPGESAESLLRRADSALYVAKREGRNRLAMAG